MSKLEDRPIRNSSHIHIVSQYSGCVVGLPPDTAQIADTLYSYATQQEVVELELLDLGTDDLGEWADIVASAA